MNARINLREELQQKQLTKSLRCAQWFARAVGWTPSEVVKLLPPQGKPALTVPSQATVDGHRGRDFTKMVHCAEDSTPLDTEIDEAIKTGAEMGVTTMVLRVVVCCVMFVLYTCLWGLFGQWRGEHFREFLFWLARIKTWFYGDEKDLRRNLCKSNTVHPPLISEFLAIESLNPSGTEPPVPNSG